MRTTLTLLLLFLVSPAVLADGGTLRLSREQAGLRISVFTSPTPLRAGDVDVSVLVQDANNGKVLLGLPVRVQASSRDDPIVLDATASHDLATNKFLQAAHLVLPRPGLWLLLVRVNATEVEVEIDLTSAPSSWWGLAPWIAWPFAIVLLYALRVTRRRPAPPTLTSSRSAAPAP